MITYMSQKIGFHPVSLENIFWKNLRGYLNSLPAAFFGVPPHGPQEKILCLLLLSVFTEQTN